MRVTSSKSVRLEYFAVLREHFGLDEETVTTAAQTPRQLFEDLCRRRGLQLPSSLFRVAVNGRFASWDAYISDNDHVVFIQPVAGG